jgi:protein-disulfide isomerase
MSVGGRIKGALDVISTVAVILAAGTLVWTIVVRPTMGTPPGDQVTIVEGLRLDAARLTNVSGTGSIAIVEFSDFECPFCSRYARDVFPTLKRDLVDSGTVRYVALHYPLEDIHPLAAQAAEAAEYAAQQARFWEMSGRLFIDTKALARANLL